MIITSANHLGGYKIEVVFNDGTIKIIDLYDYVSENYHPLINKYHSLDLFVNFTIDCGTLAWGENDFHLSPESIYSGKFDSTTK